MQKTRIQLTLFIDESESAEIEKIRGKFNPVQFALIKSHVTLCREHELEQIENIMNHLQNIDYPYISIPFGPLRRFAEGKGVLMPAIGDLHAYYHLREHLLQDLPGEKDKPEPHITLMHPRNTTCSDEIFEELKTYYVPAGITFRKISLIKQWDGGKWHTLAEFNLKRPY